MWNDRFGLNTVLRLILTIQIDLSDLTDDANATRTISEVTRTTRPKRNRVALNAPILAQPLEQRFRNRPARHLQVLAA
jgi:hypothetical protein